MWMFGGGESIRKINNVEKEVFIFFGFLEIKMVIEILVKECFFILCFVCKNCR